MTSGPPSLSKRSIRNSGVSSAASPLKFGHFVIGAVERALGRGAVVADDIIHERVGGDPELLQAVKQPSDVVVGVLQPAYTSICRRRTGLRASGISSQLGICAWRAVSYAS